MMWILPVFEAQPKLAPIFNPVDHMVPPAFPLLLVVPAIAIDLIVRYFRGAENPPLTLARFLRDTALAIPLGILFTSLLLAAQWHFSKFLISPASENWFFAGGHFFPYTSNYGAWRHKFWDIQEDPLTLKRVIVAMLWAILFCRIGLGFGSWMAKVRR